MSHSPAEIETEDDAYAEYDAVLVRGIAISGEDKNYFVRAESVGWLVSSPAWRSFPV
jgi:hypothetical protein